MARRLLDVEALVEQATTDEPARRARAVGRLISLVEDASPALREVMALLASRAGSARVIGLTCSPGVGKSTSTSVLVSAYRRRGMRVGVLAVDPSSPFSGGALLGDRVRMQDHAIDDGVFIRSMATRGHLGGLSWATPQALRVLSAAGCDVVLVETVGVGQAEVDVARLADTTLVLLAPGMGDAIQAAKAGILEVADVFVVNKADRDGADRVVSDLRHMQSLGPRSPAQAKVAGEWVAPVVKTSATPKDFSSARSSAGMIPPPKTTTSEASASRSSCTTRAKSVRWAPESTDSPTQSASSWMTVETICSGVWCSPV